MEEHIVNSNIFVFFNWIDLLNTIPGIQHAKGNRAFADLIYEEEDSISLSTHIFAATKG